jgi:hypothetical protein
MTDISNIKITIAFTDTDLYDEDKNQEVQKLLNQMQKLVGWDDINYNRGQRGHLPTVGRTLCVGYGSDRWVSLLSHRDL